MPSAQTSLAPLFLAQNLPKDLDMYHHHHHHHHQLTSFPSKLTQHHPIPQNLLHLRFLPTMPPKRAQPSSSSKSTSAATSRSQPTQSTAGSVGVAFHNVYDAVTARENQSFVKAIGMFGVSCVFLSFGFLGDKGDGGGWGKEG